VIWAIIGVIGIICSVTYSLLYGLVWLSDNGYFGFRGNIDVAE
jgi:hypothetical protein